MGSTAMEIQGTREEKRLREATWPVKMGSPEKYVVGFQGRGGGRTLTQVG